MGNCVDFTLLIGVISYNPIENWLVGAHLVSDYI